MPASAQLKQYAQIVGRLLRQHGYNLPNIDINDPDMQAAISHFAISQGLPPSTVATPEIFARLQQPPSAKPWLATAPRDPTNVGRGAPQPAPPMQAALPPT